MLNARPIDKFYLSGGWQNLPLDVAMLQKSGVKFVLDLQYTLDDEHEKMTTGIRTALEEVGIEYYYITMYDGDFFAQDLHKIFSFGAGLLVGAELKYTDSKDKILVKCGAGTSRSPAMLIAAYGYLRKWSYQESLEYIRRNEKGTPGLLLGADPSRAFSDYLKSEFGNYSYKDQEGSDSA